MRGININRLKRQRTPNLLSGEKLSYLPLRSEKPNTQAFSKSLFARDPNKSNVITDKNDGNTPLFGGNQISSLFRDFNKGF
jgi:hypothetical protein